MIKFEAIKEQLITNLNQRLPDLKCPMCSNVNITLLDGFFNKPLYGFLTAATVVGSPVVPTVCLICNRCGHVMDFSVGALGIPVEEKQDAQAKTVENNPDSGNDQSTD